VSTVVPSGGTDYAAGLQGIIDANLIDENKMVVIVFLSDGENEGKDCFACISEICKKSYFVTLHTVLFGPSTNIKAIQLLQNMAKFGDGTFSNPSDLRTLLSCFDAIAAKLV